MGLPDQSMKSSALTDIFHIDKNDNEFVIALVGNPNTGKALCSILCSVTYRKLAGQTVVNARGNYSHQGKDFILVDLPGTYSPFSSSAEEEVAMTLSALATPMQLCWADDMPERNLNLVYQVMSYGYPILCINLVMRPEKRKLK